MNFFERIGKHTFTKYGPPRFFYLKNLHLKEPAFTTKQKNTELNTPFLLKQNVFKEIRKRNTEEKGTESIRAGDATTDLYSHNLFFN